MAYGTLSAIADATKNFAIDLISGTIFTRGKIAWGPENTANEVTNAAGLPVVFASNQGPLPLPTTSMTTRQYGAGYRAALATGAATTFALSGNLTLGASREVRIRASSALWLRFGTAATGQDAAIPATNSPAVSMPLDANMAEVIVVPAGTTHISVIADSAAGAVTFSPVA